MAAPNLVAAALVCRGGQPGSRLCHWNEAARLHDWHTAPDDLRSVIGADVDVGEPDALAERMRANLDHSPHYDTNCPHDATVAACHLDGDR